ncbi:hypothetical protein VO54_01455 [Elizabethkingia miricola]|nr:hypothetical protein VO54_01455 [Elizabethkingia miricola]
MENINMIDIKKIAQAIKLIEQGTEMLTELHIEYRENMSEDEILISHKEGEIEKAQHLDGSISILDKLINNLKEVHNIK